MKSWPHLLYISYEIIRLIIGTGVKTETTMGDTNDMSASGCGRENFNSTIGIPIEIKKKFYK